MARITRSRASKILAGGRLTKEERRFLKAGKNLVYLTKKGKEKVLRRGR